MNYSDVMINEVQWMNYYICMDILYRIEIKFVILF